MSKVLSFVGSPALTNDHGHEIEPATGVYNSNESSLTPDQIKLLSRPELPIDNYHINGHGPNELINGNGDRIPNEVTIVKSFPVRMKCVLAKRNAGTNIIITGLVFKSAELVNFYLLIVQFNCQD